MENVLSSDSYIIHEKQQETLFTKYAESYDEVVAQTSFYKKLVKNTARILENCQNVLDLGCATGNIAIGLAKLGVKVTAVDSNPAMIEVAASKIKKLGLDNNIQLNVANIAEIGLAPNSFDGIVMANVLYLLENPYDILDRAFSLLKKDGILVLAGPKPDQNLKVLIKTMLHDLNQAGHREGLKNHIEIVQQVNSSLEKGRKHFFSTERLQEILLDFVGFSEIIANDYTPGFRTYLGQGHFIAARKSIDYASLSPEKIKIRLAREDEMGKVHKIRYHFTKERLKIMSSTQEMDKSKMEWDEFDKNSFHIIAEHGEKILAIIRIVKDSNDLLPIDLEQDLSHLRKGTNIIWEPGRWISLPFSPPRTGRKILRAGYEMAKLSGVTHFAEILNMEKKDLYKTMGFKMINTSSGEVKGYTTKAYIETFPIEDPPAFFREELNDEEITSFLKSINFYEVAFKDNL